jgi:hypothetical protein
MTEKFWDTKVETIPSLKLKELQLKRLQALVHRVYTKNKYYKKKFDEAKIRPESVKSLQNIEKIPFLTKQDLRAYYPFGLSAPRLMRSSRSMRHRGRLENLLWDRTPEMMWTSGAKSWPVLSGQMGFGRTTSSRTPMGMDCSQVRMGLRKARRRSGRWL